MIDDMISRTHMRPAVPTARQALAARLKASRKKDPLKDNLITTSIAAFLESYNKSIPVTFPHPSVKILKVFQSSHPTLFKNSDEWSIDKHRKRLMDWLPSYSASL